MSTETDRPALDLSSIPNVITRHQVQAAYDQAVDVNAKTRAVRDGLSRRGSS